MNVVDKNNIIKKIKDGVYNKPIIIELGCGNRKRFSESIGIDIINYESVDIVGDVFDILKIFPNNVVSEVSSSHFFEHVDDIGLLMDEIGRILKKGGILSVIVPHFSNPYFYSDFTHKTFFGLYTFCYFSINKFFKRPIPNYNKPKFELLTVDLVFKSPPPFYFRYFFRKVTGLIFNSCNYLKEYYEENICQIISCYEIKYIMR